MSKLRFTNSERNEVAVLLGVMLGNEGDILMLAEDDEGDRAYFVESIMDAVKRALVIAEVYKLKIDGNSQKVA